MALVSIGCKRNSTYANNYLKTAFLCVPSRQTHEWPYAEFHRRGSAYAVRQWMDASGETPYMQESMASQITNLKIVYSTVYLDMDQRKHQSIASLAFVRGIHRWPVNSPHKGPVTRIFFHLMTSSWDRFILHIQWYGCWRTGRGHQHPQYWPSHLGIFRRQH